jgi:hypothetical protein
VPPPQRIMVAWMAGSVRGCFISMRVNHYDIARKCGQVKLQMTAIRRLARTIAAWCAGTTRGVVFQMKLNMADVLGQRMMRKISQSDPARKAQAIRMLSRMMSAWMGGTLRGSFFNMREGYEAARVKAGEASQQAHALRLVSRILAAWMAGTVRGCFGNIRESCKWEKWCEQQLLIHEAPAPAPPHASSPHVPRHASGAGAARSCQGRHACRPAMPTPNDGPMAPSGGGGRDRVVGSQLPQQARVRAPWG